MSQYGPTGVGAGGDDYHHSANATFASTNTFIQFGSHTTLGGECHAVMRFLGIDIATGATISASTIDFRAVSIVGSGTFLSKICAVDENDPAAATSDATCDTDDGMRTTAQPDWDRALVGTADTLVTTVDFSPVIQELDDSGFTDGSVAMLIQVINDGTTSGNLQRFASYDNASYTEPLLTVVYSLPATGFGWGFVPFGGS